AFGRLCFALTLGIALSCGFAAQSQPADLLPVARLQQLLRDYHFQEGSTLAESALQAVRGARGEKDLKYAEAMYWLGVFRDAESQYAEAAEWHAKALAVREDLLGPDALEVAQSTEHLALAYESQAQREAAEPLMLRALSLSERLLPADDPQLASTLSHVGMF